MTLLQFVVGDRLWVREAWRHFADFDDQPARETHAAPELITYTADGLATPAQGRPRSSLHMPRWASRLTLTVTDVRVQRLHDISEVDAVAEGIERMRSDRGFYDVWSGHGGVHLGLWHSTAKSAFANLWDGINGPDAWDANPWVAAYTFTVQRGNIDQVAA